MGAPFVPLPLIDSVEVVVAADLATTWAAVLAVLDASGSMAGASTFARLVGCEASAACGPRPLAEGSSIPAFRVVSMTAPSELILEGRHRFSAYGLAFRLRENGPGRTWLSTENRGAFPGAAGCAYRLLVVSSGVHGVAVAQLLGAIRRRAEATAGGA